MAPPGAGVLAAEREFVGQRERRPEHALGLFRLRVPQAGLRDWAKAAVRNLPAAV